MDLVQQFVAGMVANLLPAGNTLEKLHPISDGRIDVLVSHGVAHLASQGSPLVQALFLAARPVIDGALVATCGPVAMNGKPKRVAASKSTAVTKRRKKAKQAERTTAGIEILDAEFVDMPEVKS
jgi:hypothetical protein